MIRRACPSSHGLSWGYTILNLANMKGCFLPNTSFSTRMRPLKNAFLKTSPLNRLKRSSMCLTVALGVVQNLQLRPRSDIILFGG